MDPEELTAGSFYTQIHHEQIMIRHDILVWKISVLKILVCGDYYEDQIICEKNCLHRPRPFKP